MRTFNILSIPIKNLTSTKSDKIMQFIPWETEESNLEPFAQQP